MQTSKIDNFLGKKSEKNTFSSKCFSWQCFRVSWQSLNLCFNLFFSFSMICEDDSSFASLFGVKFDRLTGISKGCLEVYCLPSSPQYSPCTLGVSTRISNPFCTLYTPKGSIWHVANVSALNYLSLATGHLVTDMDLHRGSVFGFKSHRQAEVEDFVG